MSTTTPTKQPTPDEALQRLKDGNSRFTHDERADADLSRDRRMALAKGSIRSRRWSAARTRASGPSSCSASGWATCSSFAARATTSTSPAPDRSNIR